MISPLATAIHILTAYGMTASDVKYNLDIELANQLLGCHWLSKGLEIEYSESREEQVEEISEIIQKTSKRKHLWHLEQL